jgi:beta-N-acetylhexosaminidase
VSTHATPMLTPPDRLRDRIAQLIFPRIGSNMMPTISVEDDAARIEELMDRYPIGGLCLFNGDRIRTPQTLTRLQSRSRFPLLIATDMERGLGQQLKGATVFPHAMAFQATAAEDEALLEASARVAAREALAAGLHISFSPVADINSNPANPIISTRAYGTTPETVSRLLAAYMRGCQAEGLFATAKHFPGHGDTDVDSHEALPVVDRNRASLEELEFIPFRKAIEQGVSLIMTAHVSYPGLDASGLEATRSKRILRDVLRRDLGFKGVVISDSLLMAGAGQREEHPGEMAAALIEAGVDVLLDIKDVPATVDYLVDAVTSGRLDERLVDQAFERVWGLKVRFAARFGKGAFVDPSLAVPFKEIGAEAHRALADRVADASIQVAIGNPDTLRLPAPRLGQKGPLCFLVRPHTTYNDPTQAPLETAFLRAFPDGEYIEINPESVDDDLEPLLDRASRHSAIIVAAIVKPAAWHKFGLLTFQKQFIRDLADRYPVWLVALGSPLLLADFQDVPAGICVYSDVEPSMKALVRFLKARESDQPVVPGAILP